MLKIFCHCGKELKKAESTGGGSPIKRGLCKECKEYIKNIPEWPSPNERADQAHRARMRDRMNRLRAEKKAAQTAAK